jgi:hypothetical protein
MNAETRVLIYRYSRYYVSSSIVFLKWLDHLDAAARTMVCDRLRQFYRTQQIDATSRSSKKLRVSG